MLRTLLNAFKNKDVRKKLLITIALLFIYRIGCWLPVPGINPSAYADTLDADSILGLLSAITGGALQNGAFLAIGISPYINASIILQLLTVAIPPLERLSKQGDEGKRKLTQITRYLTLLLAAAQAMGIVFSYNASGALSSNVFGVMDQKWLIGIFVAIILISGSMFTMWLGERITDIGIGNGISFLIFIGIISTAGQSIVAKFTEMANGSEFAIWELLGFALLVIAVFLLIVLVDLSERRVQVQYAKQIKGRKQYGGQSTHIPMKLNASGVLPIIFATAILSFPQMIFQMFVSNPSEGFAGFYAWWSKWLGANTPIYSVLVGLLILFFSYFYAQIQFNPDEIARNIQQYGGFLPGIRPGKPTAEYLKRISRRLTFFGAVYLAFIAIVPSIFFSIFLSSTLINAFTATGLLIVVSVALELEKQLDSLLMMKQYKGFLK